MRKPIHKSEREKTTDTEISTRQTSRKTKKKWVRPRKRGIEVANFWAGIKLLQIALCIRSIENEATELCTNTGPECVVCRCYSDHAILIPRNCREMKRDTERERDRGRFGFGRGREWSPLSSITALMRAARGTCPLPCHTARLHS